MCKNLEARGRKEGTSRVEKWGPMQAQSATNGRQWLTAPQPAVNDRWSPQTGRLWPTATNGRSLSIVARPFFNP
jgi:hypothetical protein